MTTGAPNIVRDKMSTYCIYLPSLVRIDSQMMPQWSKTCIFGLFYAFYAMLRHAATCYITTWAPNIVRDKMSTYCIYMPSLVKIDWQTKYKNIHFWLIFMLFTPRHATPRHATWHVRRCPKCCQDQNESICAFIYQVWWELVHSHSSFVL